MDKVETIEVSYDFCKGIAAELANFSIGFVILIHDKQPDAKPGGSGTLVHAAGRHAILTADHVLQALPERGEVGLVLSSMDRPQLHRFTFPMEGARKITVARGTTLSEGPDLGLMILPEVTANEIEARNKGFYNLEKRRDRILSNPPSINTGIWYLSGMPVVWAKDVPAEKGFQRLKEFRGICDCVKDYPTEQQRGAFDYLRIEIPITEAYKGPKDFEGVSGGSLWHVDVGKSEDGKPVVKDKILSGVPYYQDRESNPWTITCHERKSIYGAVVDALEKDSK